MILGPWGPCAIAHFEHGHRRACMHACHSQVGRRVFDVHVLALSFTISTYLLSTKKKKKNISIASCVLGGPVCLLLDTYKVALV
jgi:hypothetical protein